MPTTPSTSSPILTASASLLFPISLSLSPLAAFLKSKSLPAIPLLCFTYHRGAIAVGQFMMMAGKEFYRLVKLVEAEEAELALAHKAEMPGRMYPALDSDLELQALRDWYLTRSCYFGYKAIEREGFCGRDNYYSLKLLKK